MNQDIGIHPFNNATGYITGYSAVIKNYLTVRKACGIIQVYKMIKLGVIGDAITHKTNPVAIFKNRHLAILTEAINAKF